MLIQNYEQFLHNYTLLKKSFKVRETTNYVEVIFNSGKKPNMLPIKNTRPEPPAT